jgi:hypothetical protein
MANLVNTMANLKVGDNDSSDSDDEKVIPFTRKLFAEDTYNNLLQRNENFEMLKTKEALIEIWRLIELNNENSRYEADSVFPYKTKKDASKSHYVKKDYWLCFLNQFFCASLDNWNISINETDKELMKIRESQIGLTPTKRNGDDGWFNRLCYGVRRVTNVQVDLIPVVFDDKDYQPFLSSRDTFSERFQALMFDLVDLDCHPRTNYASPGDHSPYNK